VTSGPSLLVDQILAASATDSIENLVDNLWGRDISAFLSPSAAEQKRACLFIRERSSSNADRLPSPPIYHSPRIGLELSHPGTTPSSTSPLHPRIVFLARRYRFFIYPTELVANGRAHTFLGLLFTILGDEIVDGALADNGRKRKVIQEIVKLGGFQMSTAERYMDDFLEGRKGGATALDAFIGLQGKGASSGPRICLRMFGALSTIVSMQPPSSLSTVASSST